MDGRYKYVWGGAGENLKACGSALLPVSSASEDLSVCASAFTLGEPYWIADSNDTSHLPSHHWLGW